MFLDPDVLVSCDDIKFSLTSWQSSQHSILGYFPRMHMTISPGHSDDVATEEGMKLVQQFRMLDHWSYVWYNKVYSLLLPAGVILNRDYLKVRISI